MRSLKFEALLEGVKIGRPQSAGAMTVLPLLVRSEEEMSFSPPHLEVSTTSYGTINLWNKSDRATIVPPGAGWVTAKRAQDHALGGGLLLGSGDRRTVNTAMCIEAAQGGFISRAAHEMLILPAALRPTALAIRNEANYAKLWKDIEAFNRGFSLQQVRGHLVDFLKRFSRELDDFVAQFELLEEQLGAIVLINGRFAGLERAPSREFFRALFVPLIRLCYGSLAIAAQRASEPPAERVSLQRFLKPQADLGAIERALDQARETESQRCLEVVQKVAEQPLKLAWRAEERIGEHRMLTVQSDTLSGQIVRRKKRTAYASVVGAAA